MLATYKPSGKYSPLSTIYLVLVCATLVPALAWLYAYAIWYCPLIYINFFITLGFGALMGVAVAFIVIHKGKVRSPATAILFGIIAGLWGWYLHWAIWIDLAINAEAGSGIVASHVNYDELLDLIRDPVGLFRIAGLINEEGLWSIFKITFSGFALWLVWLVETIIILALPPISAVSRAKSPFSEHHGKWAKEIKLNPLSYPTSAIKQAIEAGDLSALKKLEQGSKEDNHCEVTLFDAYDGIWFISLTAKLAQTNDKGKLKFEDHDMLEYAAIDMELANLLQHVEEADLNTIAEEKSESNANAEAKFNSENTKHLAQLLQVDPSERNEDWHKSFNLCILTASFASGDPQVIEGPDGMPYFQLQFPESKKPFNPFSLLHIKDHVLQRGFGVALRHTDGQVVWSVPYGAMVNLHLNGQLFTESDHPTLPEREVLQVPTEVLTGQPAEDFFPTATRQVLKKFLKTHGIAEPRMMLMARHRAEGDSTELVFNIFAEDFPSEQHFEELMHQVQWYLPRQYVITVVPKKPEFTENLKPL